jgi:hypothetical protein
MKEELEIWRIWGEIGIGLKDVEAALSKMGAYIDPRLEIDASNEIAVKATIWFDPVKLKEYIQKGS